MIMGCCLTELRSKEVINRETGNRIGPVCDVELDAASGRITAIIVYGRPKILGLFGSSDDVRIPWENVDVIGDETILVSRAEYCRRERSGRGR